MCKSLSDSAEEVSGRDNRWVSVVEGEKGQARITLRDATGTMASEYVEKSASSGPEMEKEYVHRLGRLLVVNSTCGPRPGLMLADPPKVGTQIQFLKTDYVPAAGSYTIFIEAEDGQHKTLDRTLSAAPLFGIEESELFANQTNWISIEEEASCGHTGYSNAVSYKYTPAPDPSCIHAMANNRNPATLGGDGSSSMVLAAVSNCLGGTLYHAYFKRIGTGDTLRLTFAGPVNVPRLNLPNQPPGTGYGEYWFTPVNPVTRQEGVAGPHTVFDHRNELPSGGGGPQAAPSVNAQYVHWDHLGSVRVITDEQGAEIGHWKYYPFGQAAEASGGVDNRVKFTGHERDAGLGLDYMLARYYSSSLSRFLSADPGDDTDMGIPQTWNAYSYVRNNPLKFLDTTGEATTLHSSTQTYEVTGNTAAEAWSNAAAQNPDGFAGHTSWSIAITKIDTMEAGSQELGTAVSMATDVDVSVTTTTTLPSWNAPAGAPAGEQQKFDSEKAGLAQHEQGHVQIAEKGGRSLEQTVKNSVGTGQGATTGQAKANAKGDLKQKAEKSRQDQVKKTDKKQKDYDKKTGHGRRQ